MWVYTREGFLSIVAHRAKSRHLLVRARFAGHLEALFPNAEIQTTPHADYRYRTVLPAKIVADCLAFEVRHIDYPNFKNAVDLGDYHQLLERTWAAARLAQEDA